MQPRNHNHSSAAGSCGGVARSVLRHFEQTHKNELGQQQTSEPPAPQALRQARPRLCVAHPILLQRVEVVLYAVVEIGLQGRAHQRVRLAILRVGAALTVVPIMVQGVPVLVEKPVQGATVGERVIVDPKQAMVDNGLVAVLKAFEQPLRHVAIVDDDPPRPLHYLGSAHAVQAR